MSRLKVSVLCYDWVFGDFHDFYSLFDPSWTIPVYSPELTSILRWLEVKYE